MTGLFESLPITVGPKRKRFNWRKVHNAYRRHADDWYVEGPECVEALAQRENIIGPVLDPSCGGGNIPLTLRRLGIECLGSDIIDRGFPGVRIADFLADDFELPFGVQMVVANPPYRAAQEFAVKAMGLGVWKCCMILRLAFLEGQDRGDWYLAGGDNLARVWVSTKRLSMPPGDEFHNGTVEAEGGKIAYAWFCWERGWRGPPQLGWF